jgi:outer membrane immunogenic protein
MKKLLLGTVALAALAVPALAADMGVVRRPVAYVAATNWTGCYVGGDVGYMVGRDSGYSTTAATTFGIPGGVVTLPGAQVGQLSQPFNTSGVAGGFYGGCNYQFGVWVIGAEGDWTVNNNEGQAFLVNGPSTVVLPGGIPAAPGAYFSTKENWVTTARARLGYAVDKWLLYVTGGAAWARIVSQNGFTPIGPLAGLAVTANDQQSDTRSGWTIGGGLEYMLPYNWSIRAEYLYVKIPSYTTFNPGTGNGPLLQGNPVNLQHDLSNNIVRFGLAYTFGAYGKAVPAVTK